MANNFFKRTGAAFLAACKKNWWVMLLSAVFAVILWGYVMAGLNLPRQKTVNRVPITLVGTSDLKSRNLIVVNWDSPTTSVGVSAEINRHSSIDASRIDCTVNLNKITEPGVYNLPVEAEVQSRMGEVVSRNPAYVRVEVDVLRQKPVPVQLKTIGELPEGYAVQEQSLRSGTLILQNGFVTLQGADRYITPVSRAEVVVDLMDRTDDFNGAVVLVFYDSAGEEVEVITVNDQAPELVANINISAFREVPVKINALHPDETLFDTIIKPIPEWVTIYGKPEDLALVEEVETEYFEIADKEAFETLRAITLMAPENVTLKTAQVSVSVQVTERIYTEIFEVIVTIRNIGKGLHVPEDFIDIVTVTVLGNKAQMEGLTVDEIIAVLDAKGLGEGEHELVIAFEPIRKRPNLVFFFTPETMLLPLLPN